MKSLRFIKCYIIILVLLPSLALAEEDGQSEDQTTAIVEADSLGEADFDTEQDIAVESNANSSNEYGFEYPETPENGRLIEMVTEKDGKKFYYFVSIEDVDYEVKVEKGLPIKLVFNDGREATFYRRKTFFKDVEIDVDFAESTCSTRFVKPTCKVYFDFRRDTTHLVWTKHSDPTKLNRPVEVVIDGEATTSLDLGEEFLVIEMAKDRKELSSELVQHRLKCDNYDWLPNPSVEAPEHLHINTWSVETNTDNPETERNENRSTFGALGVELKRYDNQTLIIDSMRRMVSNDFFGFLWFEDIVGWTLPTFQGYCDVSFKVNLVAKILALIEPSEIPFNPAMPHVSEFTGELLEFEVAQENKSSFDFEMWNKPFLYKVYRYFGDSSFLEANSTTSGEGYEILTAKGKGVFQ